MKTKLIAILLLITMASSFVVYAQGESLLDAINLTPFQAEETVTRGAFVAKVVSALKLDSAASADAPYTDIAGSPYEAAIRAAYSIGLVAPAETFQPDAAILTIDAYRVVLAATGWVPKVKAMGGTDADYMILVRDLYLNDNILSDNNAGISVQDANTLLYHMLTCEIAEQITFGTHVLYKSQEEKNLLALYYNIKKAEGIVTANEYTSLNAVDDAAAEGKIRIGSTEYEAEGQYDLLGKQVEAFYHETTKEIISITVEDTKTLTIASEDLEDVTDRTLTYYEGDKERRATLADSFSCIKNGKKLDIYSKNLKALFTEKQCVLTLIDADEDKKYETVLMDVWQYCYVDVIDDEKKVLYDKYDDAWNIDLSGNDVKVLFQTEGLTFESIKKEMLLTFTCSDDGNLYRIKMDYSMLDGSVSTINQDLHSVTISDTKYTMTQYFEQNFSALGIGRKGSFYLNEKGEIVLFVPATEAFTYGWVIAVSETGVFDTVVHAKIYTQEDHAQAYTFAKKVAINGGTAEKISQDILNGNLQPANKLVKFRVNEQGEIYDIYFPKQMTNLNQISDESGAFYQTSNGSYRWVNVSSAEGVMAPNPGNPSGGFQVDAGTYLFVIPATESLRSDEENFTVLNGPNGIFSSNGIYTLTAFDSNENGTANVVMYLDDQMASTSSISRTRLLYANVVEDKMYSIDKEGNKRVELFVCNGKEYQTIYSGESNYDALDTVEPGDIIRYELDKDGTVKNFHLDFDFSSKSLNQVDASGATYNLSNPFSGIGYKMGYLYDKSNSFMRIFEDSYRGDGKYRTDYTYENLTGYPVNPTYSVYVHVTMREDGTIDSLTTHRAGAADVPKQYKLTGDGTADFALVALRSATRISNIFYDITVK